MHWHYKDPTTGKLVKSKFERPNTPVQNDVITTVIKVNPLTKCNLEDKKIPDSVKFKAIKTFAKTFAKEKSKGNHFTNISLISHCDFASALLYLRNHVQHVGQGKKGFTKTEIKDIETIIKVFFELDPIGDNSISTKFDNKILASLKEYSPEEMARLENLSKALENNTAQARLQDWIADLTPKYGDLVKKQNSGSLGDHKSKVSYNGISIRIKRNGSNSYGLHEHGNVLFKLQNEISLNVGSRGFTVDELKPFGYCFDHSNRYSLAVKDPYMLPSL